MMANPEMFLSFAQGVVMLAAAVFIFNSQKIIINTEN